MKFKALLVEDKDFISNIIIENLHEYFDCVRVTNAEEAIAAGNQFDVAVVSLNIMGTSGETLLTEIKEKWHIPVLMLTSNNTSSVRIKMLRKGADDIMVKPFNPEELMLRVLRLVKNKMN